MKMRVFFRITHRQLSHMIFHFQTCFFLFSPSDWHNLLWRYALVWLVAPSPGHIQSTTFMSRRVLASVFNFTLVSCNCTLQFKRSRTEALLLSRMVRIVFCHCIVVYCYFQNVGMTYIHFCLLWNPMLAAPTTVPGAQPCFTSPSQGI